MILFLSAAGCGVKPPAAEHAGPAIEPPKKFHAPAAAKEEPQAAAPAAPAATFAAEAPRLFRTSVAGISISGVIFDQRTHHLQVADQSGGPGSKWPDARAAGLAYGGIAAVNAGFFTPEGAPLGLVVSQGKRAGSFNRSSLGAGFVIGGGSSALIRREHWSSAFEAVQSGPFLLENGRSPGGLSQVTSTARTFIATDGSGRWVIARTGPCSLEGLASALNGASLGGMKPATVLNLDGGRSSDLWVAGSVAGGPLHERPVWNKPVRNFLVLAPQSS